MSIFRDDCIFHGQLLADYVAQLVKSEKPEPLSPSPDGQEAQLTPRQSGDFPFVGSIYGDEE